MASSNVLTTTTNKEVRDFLHARKGSGRRQLLEGGIMVIPCLKERTENRKEVQKMKLSNLTLMVNWNHRPAVVVVKSHAKMMLVHSEIIVITFYSPSCPGQEAVKGPCGFQVKLSTAHHTRWRLHTVPSNYWTSSREAVNITFYSLWVWPDRKSNSGLPF